MAVSLKERSVTDQYIHLSKKTESADWNISWSLSHFFCWLLLLKSEIECNRAFDYVIKVKGQITCHMVYFTEDGIEEVPINVDSGIFRL